MRTLDRLSGLRHSRAACARAAKTWGSDDGIVADSDHSARRRRLLCCFAARRVARISGEEEKYHRLWARTVASKNLPLSVDRLER